MAQFYFVKNYEFIEHTADIGIRVHARSLKELFENSARAMFEIIADKKDRTGADLKTIKIKQQAQTRQELFINWLNELLSLSAVKGLVFSDFKITRLDDESLEAAVSGSDMAGYRVNTEIKAATYHQLKLKEEGGRWVAEVIFDV